MKKMLLAILIAAPLSSLFGKIIDHLLMPKSLREDYYKYYSFLGDILITVMYEIPIYLIVGIQ